MAFTADPVTGDPEAVRVEAVLGTGERLVSGAATPDEWVVRGDSAVRRGSGEEAIDAAVARAVAALARQVEQHQGCPQDVEWALAGETVVLLQARPITALRERPIDLVPVPVEPPHGYWRREASHAPVPWNCRTRADGAAGWPSAPISRTWWRAWTRWRAGWAG